MAQDKIRCFEEDCEASAVHMANPVPQASWEDFTYTCDDHLGKWLGTVGDQKVEHYTVWPIGG